MKKDRSSLSRLAQDSVKLIRWNQHVSGAYVACPLFQHYVFGWLRDGSFTAYAMDLAGEHDSSRRFHDWVRRIVHRKLDLVRNLLDKFRRSEPIGLHEFLHTRYHLDGRDDAHSEWGHFQLDGYGTWLWAFFEHLRMTGEKTIPEPYRASVEAVSDYLAAFWHRPNFDCWEEHPEHVHPATLACIYGGLHQSAKWLERDDLLLVCRQISAFIEKNAVHPDKGTFCKFITPVNGDGHGASGYTIGHSGTDASLLWLVEPFQLFSPQHPVMARTLEAIRRELRTSHGGIRRYEDDTYYGGGEWILLTAWYGWTALAAGERVEAEEALLWIAAKADSHGRFPEQVPDALADLSGYDHWVNRWGPPALPLIWSHAMYLVLYCKLFNGTD